VASTTARTLFGIAAARRPAPGRPNNKVAAVTQIDLAPNEFRQLNSMLRTMGIEDAYNASLTIRGAVELLSY
jgi:hypothetical protein